MNQMKSRIANSVMAALIILSPLVRGQDSGVSSESGHPSFIEPGTWWNLYFSEENDPLRRGSRSVHAVKVHAVKILEVDECRTSWIRIKFPKKGEEHLSILGPAARALDDEGLSTAAALSEWEETVSEWRVMWVNLRFVVYMTKIEPDASATGRRSTRAEGDSTSPAPESDSR